MSERGLGVISSRYDPALSLCADGAMCRSYVAASPILNTKNHVDSVMS
jgi:hypothetical protein